MTRRGRLVVMAVVCAWSVDAHAELEHTGAARLIGASFGQPDIAGLPTASSEFGWLGGLVGRYIVADKGYPWQWEANLFVDATRSATDGLSAFGTVGRRGSVYRHEALRWQVAENNDFAVTAGVDRLYIKRAGDVISMTFGRFPINWSVTSILTPNDFFAPFAAAAINRIYKPGVDGALVEYAFSPTSGLAVAAIGASDTDGDFSLGSSALLVRYTALVDVGEGGFQVATIAGHVHGRYIGGLSAQGDVGSYNIRAEGHVGRKTLGTQGTYVRAALGIDTQLPWRNGSFSGDVSYFSDGGAGPDQYLTRAASLLPDELPMLGRGYAAMSIAFEILPILRAGGFGLSNLGDLSGMAGLSLSWSAADEADVALGAFLPWGEGAKMTAGGLDLGSEMGASAATLYLEARAFF